MNNREKKIEEYIEEWRKEVTRINDIGLAMFSESISNWWANKLLFYASFIEGEMRKSTDFETYQEGFEFGKKQIEGDLRE